MPKSGEELIEVVVWVTVLFILLTGIIILFMVKFQSRHKKFIEQRNSFTQTLLQSQLEIQEQTLKNISQEIHDNIGQVLSLVKLNLYTIEPADPDQLEMKIQNSRLLVSKAISDLRDLSHSMNTDYVEQKGLMRAIEYELEMIRKSGTLKTHMEIRGDFCRFERQKELIIFRIVQEIFQNVIKHAQASMLVVIAECNKQDFSLQIRDDGKGLDLNLVNDLENSFGLGIRNMHKRAAMIGCIFRMESELGVGTQAVIRSASRQT